MCETLTSNSERPPSKKNSQLMPNSGISWDGEKYGSGPRNGARDAYIRWVSSWQRSVARAKWRRDRELGSAQDFEDSRWKRYFVLRAMQGAKVVCSLDSRSGSLVRKERVEGFLKMGMEVMADQGVGSVTPFMVEVLAESFSGAQTNFRFCERASRCFSKRAFARGKSSSKGEAERWLEPFWVGCGACFPK